MWQELYRDGDRGVRRQMWSWRSHSWWTWTWTNWAHLGLGRYCCFRHYWKLWKHNKPFGNESCDLKAKKLFLFASCIIVNLHRWCWLPEYCQSSPVWRHVKDRCRDVSGEMQGNWRIVANFFFLRKIRCCCWVSSLYIIFAGWKTT